MAETWSKFGITTNAIGSEFCPTELTKPVFDGPVRADLYWTQRAAFRYRWSDFIFVFRRVGLYHWSAIDGGWGGTAKMKALVYEGVETLAMRDRPMPQPGPDEVLMRVAAAGICGSDMHAYLGHDARRPAPLILGHEAAGTVAGGAMDGHRVTVNPLVTCGLCPACKAGRENLCPHRQIISMQPREGAFAEYVAIPERNLVTVPDDVPLDKAALTEPLAVSWHAARLALAALHPDVTPRALVLGGGAIGLAAALIFNAKGVEDVEIVEPNINRTARLRAIGQTVVETASGEWPVVVDAVGYAVTRATASTHVMPGGVIAHVGLGEEDTSMLDIRRLTLQEVTFIGTYTYTNADFRDTAQAIFDGTLGPLDWIEHRPLSDGPRAFDDLRYHRVSSPKIVLSPGS